MSPSPNPVQTQILRTYTALYSLRSDRNGDWGGALILACGLNEQGAALALAANIAGAVCLNIEDNPATLKEAIRSGSCDFIVNTVDEALRAMKNEVRKHLPLSVGLQCNPTQALQELLERGVSPQLFTDLTHTPSRLEAMQRFKASGSRIVSFDSNHPVEKERIGEILDADALIEAFIHPRQWHLSSFFFNTTAAMRTFDAEALSQLPEDDLLRRRWLSAAPRILQRERPIHRTLWLTQTEEELIQQ
jgi:hypothetical protein